MAICNLQKTIHHSSSHDTHCYLAGVIPSVRVRPCNIKALFFGNKKNMSYLGKRAAIFFLALSCAPSTINAYTPSTLTSIYQTFRTSATSLNLNKDENVTFESAVNKGWKPSRGTFVGISRKSTYSSTRSSRSMSDTNGAVMPDGGLSPCIIKVVGVGGGGCNAVSKN
jgi:hypothetical protein